MLGNLWRASESCPLYYFSRRIEAWKLQSSRPGLMSWLVDPAGLDWLADWLIGMDWKIWQASHTLDALRGRRIYIYIYIYIYRDLYMSQGAGCTAPPHGMVPQFPYRNHGFPLKTNGFLLFSIVFFNFLIVFLWCACWWSLTCKTWGKHEENYRNTIGIQKENIRKT